MSSRRCLTPPHRPTLSRPSVLIVEDAPVCRFLAATALHARGHLVRLAVDKEEAITAFAEETFDLVLMDVRLPDGADGPTLTRLLRRYELSRGRRTPVVAVTSHTTPADLARYRDAGMDGVVAKPYATGLLFAVIDAALASTVGARIN